MNALVQDSWSMSRLPLISAWRELNTIADQIFYDIRSLTAAELEELSSYLTPEGRLLIVHPRFSKKQIRCLTPLEFVKEQLKRTSEPVDTLAIAGVGSSALGTAALARDVADHIGRPVAGIVSGLGLSDIVAEALGGWFIFGLRNILRDAAARTLDLLGIKDHVRDQASHDDIRAELEKSGLVPECFIYGSPDSTACLYCLTRLGSRIKLLVGHSKGNYSIENAIEGFRQSLRASANGVPDIKIVTLSAVVSFNPEQESLRQLIGSVDVLGMLNSRLSVPCTWIAGAGHSTNTRLPGGLSVSQALERAGIPS